MSALILDGHLKSALATVRSLGTRGIRITAGATRKTALALHSRYVTDTCIYPSPYSDEQGFVGAIEAAAIRLGDKPVIYTFSDATFLAVFAHYESLSRVATIVLPPARAREIAFDKAVTQSLARVLGIPTIPTYMPNHEEELIRIASTLTYPAVVKPRKSVTYAHGVGHFGSAVFVHTPDELIQEYHLHVSRVGEAPLIQTRIAGEEYGVEMIARDGNPCALVTHHRMRSLRPTGGASVLKEIVGPSILRDTLEMHARRLVLDLEWNGPIMVEFKVDSDTREPLLMEVNGRFWGSLPLSVAAGVDMPYHFYEFATRGSFPSTQPGEPRPIVSRHFLGDCMHLVRVLFSRDRMRPYAYPSRMHALRAFFSVPRGTVDDVWSRNDLRPGLYEIIDIVHTLWK